MRWGRSLSKTTQEYNFGASCDYAKQLCNDFGFGDLKGSSTLAFEKTLEIDAVLDDAGQRKHRHVLGRLLRLDVLTSRTQLVNCPLTSELRPLVMKATSNAC